MQTLKTEIHTTDLLLQCHYMESATACTMHICCSHCCK